MNEATDTPAHAPAWDLSDLFHGPDDPRLDLTLAEAKHRAEAFASRYKGQIGRLAAEDAPGLSEALRAYEAILQESAKPATYANLRFAADSAPENGALFQRVRERTTEASLPLLFFDVELTQVPAETLAAAAAHPALANYTHYLTTVQARAAFRLSEPEERILEEQANTGRRAFVRLFQELTSNLEFTIPGKEKPLTLPEALDLQRDTDRTVRETSAAAITDGLQPQARTITFLFNTLIQEKATEDRLRGYAYPEQARHLGNELAPETVEIVVQTAERGHPLVARYYEAKRRLLGLDKLLHYDRYAPVVSDERIISFPLARDMVLSAFAGFHPDYAAAARAFFDNGWMDVPPRPGKRGGAFCSYVTPDLHPYIFLNYLNKPGDVRTLAHELGHGIHSYLSRGQSYLNFHGTLPMAEVASTFAEMLVFDARQAQERDPLALLGQYADQIDQAIATIFRQAALYRFEQAIHAARRSGELSVARFGELWQENVGAMFAGSVEMGPGHANWWTYVSHFVATPFYVYAYTFGEMLAYALYTRFRAEGAAAFAPGYLEMLRLAGARSPRDLVAPLGVDLDEPAFWQGALSAFEEQVTRFEELSKQAGKITSS